MKKLGEILRAYRLGGNYSNSENKNETPLIKMGNIDRGRIKLDKIEYIEDNEIDENDRIKEGDLFFNTRNTLELVGKVAIWKNELTKAYYNSNLLRIEFDNNYFMNYRLNSFQGIKKLRRIATGTTSVAAIYTRDLLKIKLSIPSKEEQTKISIFLTKLDERIQLQRELTEDLKSLIKGYQQKLFSQEIRFKDDKGNNFEDWEIKKLDNTGKVFNGLTGKTKGNFGNGKLYIQYKQIFDNSKIDISNCGLVEIEQNENQTKMLYGDIFFTTSSETPNEIAFSSVLLDEIEEVYLNSFCFCFRPNQQFLNPVFAQFLFRSNYFRKKIIPLAQGSTRYNISKKEFLKIKIQLPSIKEQQKIADFLSKLLEKLETEQKLLSAYEQQKKYFLQNMFV